MAAYWEYTELAAYVLGYTEEEYEVFVNESREDEIEDKLYEKHNVDIEQFTAIVDLLLPFTMPLEAALSGKLKHCFGVFEEIGFRSVIDMESKLIKKEPEPTINNTDK